MNSSPLKQVNLTPAAHRPKAASLYDNLWKAQDHPPGFWVELFILPLSRPHLVQALEDEPREAIVANPVVLQTLFQAGTSNMEAKDHFIATNSLEILQVVLGWLLDQKFPSQEVIAAIAPLDKIDKVFADLRRGIARCLEFAPQTSLGFLREILPKAVGTSVATLLSSKNMFRPLINLIDTEFAAQALVLIGIFGLLNKREDHVDPYKERISDFIDEDAIQKICIVVGRELEQVSGAPQQKSWLSYFQKSEPREVNPAPLPILHVVYEFCLHNELFAVHCLQEPRFSVPFFAVATQIAQSQHRGQAYRNYAIVILFILRTLVERPSALAELCSTSNQQVFLCSQDRAPQLALNSAPQVPLAGLLDTVQCCLRFNIRKTFDHDMYKEVLELLLATQLALQPRCSTVSYDWQQLWRTIFSVANHMAKEDVVGDPGNCLLLLQSLAIFSLNPVLVGDEYGLLLQKAANSKELISRFNLKYGLNSTATAKTLRAIIDQHELLAQDTAQLSEAERTAQIVKQGQFVLGGATGSDTATFKGIPKFSEYSRRRFFAQEVRTLLAGARAGLSGAPGGANGGANGLKH